jgi:hypothetical protein
LNLRHPAPKAGALPDCATPRGFLHDVVYPMPVALSKPISEIEVVSVWVGWEMGCAAATGRVPGAPPEVLRWVFSGRGGISHRVVGPQGWPHGWRGREQAGAQVLERRLGCPVLAGLLTAGPSVSALMPSVSALMPSVSALMPSVSALMPSVSALMPSVPAIMPSVPALLSAPHPRCSPLPLEPQDLPPDLALVVDLHQTTGGRFSR